MEHTDILLTISQIAITLIGFSGIVIVFGERANSNWSAEEHLSFYALITPTLTVLFCSFVPILIGMTIDTTDTIWRASNAILGIAHLGNIVAFFANPQKAKITSGQKINGIIGFLTITAHFLAAAAILPWYEAVFVFGLIQQIWIGILNFLLLFKPRASNAS